jgi:hypothetical protein
VTAQQPPYALQASSHSAELFRRMAGSGLSGAGVVKASDLLVAQNTGTDLKCQVAPGQVWIPGTLGSQTGMQLNRSVQAAYSGAIDHFTTQGSYYGFNDAAITGLSFAAAHPTNPRIDLVVATVLDAQYAGATNSWVVQIITGTAAGSPVPPAIPDSSIVLAEVSIAAGATTVVNANISDVRPFAVHGLTAGNVGADSVATSESTSSASAGNLTTVGPSVDVIVPATGKVRITLTCQMVNTVSSGLCAMYFVATGANTFTVSNDRRLILAGTDIQLASAVFFVDALSPGATTFWAKYASPSGGSASFAFRTLMVDVFP